MAAKIGVWFGECYMFLKFDSLPNEVGMVSFEFYPLPRRLERTIKTTGFRRQRKTGLDDGRLAIAPREIMVE